MNKAKVAIISAHEYGRDQLCESLGKGLELIGGLDKVIKPDDRVFVKVNHLSPASRAERGIITHPVLVEAVLELLKKVSTDITVGDDIDSEDGDDFQVSGFRQMCKRAGVRLINLREEGFVEIECQGYILDKVYLSSVILNADVIINLPKLKTHSLTFFTGAVKNMYGVIPVGFRRRFHSEYFRKEDFTQVITDIFAAVKPHLTIMDGIMAMEGDGPAAGHARRLGVILASRDAVALDAVATNIIGLEPVDVYTTRFGDERGLGVGNLQDIEIVGKGIKDVSVSDFKFPAGTNLTITSRLPRFLTRYLLDEITVKPYVAEPRCTGCFECSRICPVTAISETGHIVKINHDICIQCMCCHEVCRFNAIMLKRSITGQAMYFLANMIRKLIGA